MTGAMRLSESEVRAFADKLVAFHESLDLRERRLFRALMGRARAAMDDVSGYDDWGAMFLKVVQGVLDLRKLTGADEAFDERIDDWGQQFLPG